MAIISSDHLQKPLTQFPLEMSTPTRNAHREMPKAPVKPRLSGLFGVRAARVLNFTDDAEYSVHGGTAYTRRNLLDDFDREDPRGRDFADDKADIE